MLYIFVYVDDILVVGNDFGLVTDIINKLAAALKMRDLGTLNFFLGIECLSTLNGILLSQRRYTQEILKRAGMVSCKSLATPLQTNHGLIAASTAHSNHTLYRSIVGALQYLTVTWPDISFAMNKVC